MKIIIFSVILFVLDCSSIFAEPIIPGTYRFVQYVTFTDTEKEVQAVEGIIYISDKVFTEAEKSKINNSKLIVEHTPYWPLYIRDALNVCIAYKPLVKTEHSRLTYGQNITRTNKLSGMAISIPVYNWVDWGYSLKLTRSNDSLQMSSRGGKRGFGYKTERFDIHKNEKHGLGVCIDFYNQNKF